MVWLPTSPTLIIAPLTGLPFLGFSESICFRMAIRNESPSAFPTRHPTARPRRSPTACVGALQSPSPFIERSLLCVYFLIFLGASLFCGHRFLLPQCYAQPFNSPVIRQEPAISEEVEPLKDAYQQSEWRDIATGLQIKVVELSTGFLSGEITLLKTSLSHFRPQVVRAASFQRNGADVEWYSKRTGASACLNAHFFDQTGNPLGLVVSRGIEHKRMQLGGTLLTGFFLAYHKRVEIRERDKNHKGGLEGIQSGPRLVINGAVANDLDDIDESRRSGICTTSPTEYILFVASSPFRGATLKELGDILSSPQIQCEDALNFDGGGSTQLFVRQDLPGAQVGFRGIHVLGRDEVPTVLCLFPAS